MSSSDHDPASLFDGNKRRARHGRIPMAICGMLCGVVVCGCLNPAPPGRLKPRTSPNDRFRLHDAGQVMVGTTIRHTFYFRNPFDEEVYLARADDLQKSCGCTDAELTRHRLAPGAGTPLRITLSTDGKQGPVREVVSLTWTTPKQKRHRFAFAIQADVHVPLTLSPPELYFAKEEVASGTRKRVECSSDIPVNWRTAQVAARSHGLTVEKSWTDDGRLSFDVLCDRTLQGQSFQGWIDLTVQATSPVEGRPITVYDAILPVFWSQPRDFHISPAVVTFRPESGTRHWLGSFVLSGDRTSSGMMLKHLRLDGGEASFRSTRIGDSALRIEVQLSLIRPTASPRQLDLVLANDERRSIRILCSGKPTSDKPTDDKPHRDAFGTDTLNTDTLNADKPDTDKPKES